MSNQSLNNKHVAIAVKKYRKENVGPVGKVGRVLLAAAYQAAKK